jgi:hypothetical protein
MTYDRERQRELEREQAESIRSFAFQLDGEDYEALRWAAMLARRCFDRDPHFRDVERRVAAVAGKMNDQWRASEDGLRITNEMRAVLGLPPIRQTTTETAEEEA